MYYVLLPATGECISASETTLRNDEDRIIGHLTPQGCQAIPHRSLFRAVQHIRNRERNKWVCPTTWHIRKGMFHGYYFTAHHATHPLRSRRDAGDGYTVEYLILPVQDWSDR
jgi:hypothetical protein